MTYRVQPKEYHRGYCPTICDTMASAEEELALMRKHTDFEWEIFCDDDDDDEDDEDEGRPEFVLEHPEGGQVYWDYQKAVEGFNLYCDYYERTGWARVCRREARNAATINGVEVRAMCAVYARGSKHTRIDLRVRMECD